MLSNTKIICIKKSPYKLKWNIKVSHRSALAERFLKCAVKTDFIDENYVNEDVLHLQQGRCVVFSLHFQYQRKILVVMTTVLFSVSEPCFRILFGALLARF